MNEVVDLTVQRRMKAKDRIIDELVRALELAIADIRRTGYTTVPTIMRMEQALDKVK